MIFQFWARQFHQLAANPLIFAQEAAAGALGVVATARRTLTAAVAAFELIPPSPDGITEGCPPGTSWRIGLTGFVCATAATHPRAATREELIAGGILRG